MSDPAIRDAFNSVVEYFRANPEKAISADSAAVARLEGGLRCRAVDGSGNEMVTDMPAGIGGGASAPTPGGFLRAALANCDATLIALRAASQGIVLSNLEVTVTSTSDNRGLLPIDDAIAPGPQVVRVHVRLGATGVDEAVLADLVDWSSRHSPVGDAIARAVPLEVSVDIA